MKLLWFRVLYLSFIAALLLINVPGMLTSALVNQIAAEIVRGYTPESVVCTLITARRISPYDARLNRLIAHLLYNKGDYAGAIQALSGVCEKQSCDSLSMLWLGLSYTHLGREAEAVTCFSRGKASPYLVRLGEHAALDSNLVEAEKWFVRAVQADPGSELAVLALAHFYDLHQRPGEARQWYLRALELSPNNTQTYVELAILTFRQLQDRSQAEYYLYRAIELAPGQIDAYMWLGHIAYAYGEGATAEKWYRRALETDPSSAWARWFLGRTLCEAGEHKAGIRILQEAIARDARDAIAYYQLGKCYLGAGMLDQAVEAFTFAIQFETRDFYLSRAYEGLGDVYLAQGNWAEAARLYYLAATLEPSNEEVARKLGNLSSRKE